jgi:hypothetical protein
VWNVLLRRARVVWRVAVTVDNERQMFGAADAVGDPGTRLVSLGRSLPLLCYIMTPRAPGAIYKHRAAAVAVGSILTFNYCCR